MSNEYYDDLANYYRLIYPNWENSLQRQARILDGVIMEYHQKRPVTLLDASCGIGTQCIGLAELGYRVSASDLSPAEVQLAEKEAKKRGLQIDFKVADMRSVWESFQQSFAVVVSLDNSIPHLLTDEEIAIAFTQFYRCTQADGLCLISVRDYAQMEKGGLKLYPRIVHPMDDGQIVLCDVWRFEGPYYEITTYVTEDHGEKSANTTVIRGGKYYCVEIPTLEKLLRQVGFREVQTLRERFFQPLIVAKK